MKKSVILILLAAVVIAGAIVYRNKPKTAAPAPEAAAQSAPQTTEAAPAEVVAPKGDSQPTAPIKTTPAAPAAVTTQVVADTSSAAPTNSISKTIDALLSAGRGKHQMFQELVKSGQIDAAIAELQQRKAANPSDAGISTTLGEALLNKVRALHESGNADMNEMGILAMQADQNFNAALKQDPNNVEAQYVKYTSMSYWPADPSRDPDIVQHLSSLIDLQANQPSQPEFIQPYLALIRQYRKMGKEDEALATAKLAQQQFPGDPQLQQLLNGQ
jgi:tetratricopeptide (TPR) repeat protein